MAIFEVQGPDGKTYEVEAPSMEAAAEAIGSFGDMPKGGSSANPEGVADFQNRALAFGANAAQGMAFGLGDDDAVNAHVASLVHHDQEDAVGREILGANGDRLVSFDGDDLERWAGCGLHCLRQRHGDQGHHGENDENAV